MQLQIVAENALTHHHLVLWDETEVLEEMANNTTLLIKESLHTALQIQRIEMKPLPTLIAGLLADFSSSPLLVTVLCSLILVSSLEGSLVLSCVNLATAAREEMHST